jgi:aryl sulfotransferase
MFFRRGSSGAGRELLTEREIDRYRERVAGLAPADLVEWLHRDERAPRQSAGV